MTCLKSMVAERSEFLRENPQNKGNGYRLVHTYGQGRKLEFRILRNHYGNFHPQTLVFFAIKKRNVTDWQGYCIPKLLCKNRSVMFLTRFMVNTILSPASAGWLKAFAHK